MAQAPVVGSLTCPACTCRVSKPWGRSVVSSLMYLRLGIVVVDRSVTGIDEPRHRQTRLTRSGLESEFQEHRTSLGVAVSCGDGETAPGTAG
ncbi:hypothetical protein BN381_80047 [Candidatus Microthrix parvicella RN1]|uniref:Uncharacterized protein n=1 Tax=Candidatus Neomicrothrix parvicella RN1 TaxID=1229780 RepID=R4Z7H5_9ACTN|nr:hypothetical protein BN381_80047 [Candidatus Microthrix parvicella RN1]